MSEPAGIELPYDRKFLGREVVETPEGVGVQVVTIWETAGPHDLVPGGCSCHLPGAQYGTAISWPAGHRVIEIVQYEKEPEAHKGHREVVEAIRDGRLTMTRDGVYLRVTAACGHDEQTGVPRQSSSLHFRRLYAALFGNCKACLVAEAPADGCEL